MARRDKNVAVLTLQFIEEVTSKCEEQQKEVLARILSQSADTEYLKRHGMNGCVELETFKNKVPVVTYEDIQPDIQRIANGSGTSAGKAKLIPTTAEDKDSRMLLHSLYMSFINECIPELGKGKRLYFLFTKTEKKTLGGLVVSPFTTSFFKSSHFRNRPNNYTSPNEAILCPDSFQSMYTQMLCGLYERNEVLCKEPSLHPAFFVPSVSSKSTFPTFVTTSTPVF